MSQKVSALWIKKRCLQETNIYISKQFIANDLHKMMLRMLTQKKVEESDIQLCCCLMGSFG